MNESVLWILAGVLSTLLGMGILTLARRWYRQWRYGTPIVHEELLVAYGHEMAGLLDREAIGRLLAVDVPGALDVSRAVVLLSEDRNLVTTGDVALRLPVHHAAIRLVASGGEAVRVGRRLRELVARGSADLAWTAVWVPLMRGADLYGVWLLGERAQGRAYAPEDLRWLTTLARQVAVVLETIRYAEQEQQRASHPVPGSVTYDRHRGRARHRQRLRPATLCGGGTFWPGWWYAGAGGDDSESPLLTKRNC